MKQKPMIDKFILAVKAMPRRKQLVIARRAWMLLCDQPRQWRYMPRADERRKILIIGSKFHRRLGEAVTI